MNINKIGLIATDFDDLDNILHGDMIQYKQPEDCPIFRALKRLGFEVSSVVPFVLYVNGEEIEFDGANMDTIQRVALKLLQGAEVVYIHADNTNVTL